MRSFDPRRVGRLEARAWELYYRRKWAAFLWSAVGLVRAAFRMGWRDTLVGAWLVLRANQKWAPYPDNDPAAARALMTRFYRLVAANEGSTLDPVHAAELEVEWWRAHRENQYGAASKEALVVALRDLYAYTYGAAPDSVREAAQLRADAMEYSDRWARPVAIPRTRCWPRSGRCSYAPTPRYWPLSIASRTASSSVTTSRSSFTDARRS
jgi:hypothetical protein